VNNVQISGNHSFSTDELQGMLASNPGEPFSEANMATDRDVLLSYYFDAGFPAVRVEASAKPDGENKQDVAYTVTEGDRVFVDQVLLTGLHYTRGFVVSRDFELWNGDPLSQARMLDTQRKLYDLGLFSAVDMAVQNPDGSAERKNLLVHFDEARRWTFNYGFGFEVETGSPSQACPNSLVPELRSLCRAQFAKVFSTGQPTASPRVSLGVTRINFRGRDQTIVFKGNLGRLEQTAQVSLEQPRWFNHPSMTLTLSTLYDHSRNVQTFTSERVETSAAVEQNLSQITTLVYRYAYRRVKAIDNTLIVDVEQIPILSAPVRVGIPSISYIRDKRDNPIDSHKGNFTTADFGTATSWLGSETNFNRFYLQNSTYQQFGRNKWVFARSTRMGIAAPFGGMIKNSTTSALEAPFIPLPERFFAGGANSLRGFDLNGAGPRDLSFGTPLGGGGMFVNSLELRSPPVSLPFVGQNMGFVFFEDAGNVFNNPGDIWPSLGRVRQPNFSDCRNVTKAQTDNTCSFNYLSHAVGSGIRYKTPIGPVRVDVGYNLNPTTFPRYCINGCTTVNGISVPNAPGDVHTLSRWNFFFSIGQTF
jgi:outer membrane protein insertion porin family